MNTPEAPRSIQQQISTQQVGTETLVYDERRHRAFCLNESSAVIWKLANGERTLEQMRAAASLELKAPVTVAFVSFAIEELRRDGLIERATFPAAAAMSRRVALQRLGVAGALLLPAVAAIVAPTAAQAYLGGCVTGGTNGCTVGSPSVQAARAAQIRQQMQLQKTLNTQSTQPDSLLP